VGLALLKRLGVDGRCDPSHETLASDASCDEKTVRRALDTLKDLGLVRWINRLVRDGWRAAQTSNAYLLAPSEVANPPACRARRCAGHSARQTRKDRDSSVQQPVLEVSECERSGAREALARVATQRQAAIQARLLKRGAVPWSRRASGVPDGAGGADAAKD
jgi:Helix-turn-helix domain